MTAHAPKPTITPERIAWFARYYAANPAWGIFHVALEDANWNAPAADIDVENNQPRLAWAEDLREAAAWFDLLTPSQRRRLAKKASAAALAIPRSR